VGHTLKLVYQWDQPFFSVSGPPGSASDMDIILTNGACDIVLAGSAAANLGGDPYERLGVGAARYQDTPAFGVNPPLIEASSSAGGSPILFDIAGNRLATPKHKSGKPFSLQEKVRMRGTHVRRRV
jgi:hypothetical protein